MLCHFKLLSLKTPKSVNVVNVLSIVMKVVSIGWQTFIDSLGLLPWLW
jgi:hypothetical protein